MLLTPLLAVAGCGVAMPYTSMKYLDQLTRYRLTDECTVTCNPGYTGDFCQNQTLLHSRLPTGPWNQVGYYTTGSGTLRTQSINVTDIDYVQYTKQDSVLIGILNAFYAGSRVVEIALYSRSIKTVMTPSVGGTFDSLLVRGGVAYLARTWKRGLTELYDVVALSATYTPEPLVHTSARVGLMEVFIDKGMVTTFVYLLSAGSKTINACYPDGTCPVWTSDIDVSGMACGADCPNVLYLSSGSNLYRVTSDGKALLGSTGSAIYCLTGMSALNVLLYKSATVMYQHNLATSANRSLALGIPDSGLKKICSLDVSELYNQILIVQEGVIRTLEATQVICGYGLTSQALLATDATACTPCPAPPANAFWVEGSATCEWVCLAGFTRVGSKCVVPVVAPCPSYFVMDALNPGLCTPSQLPWAGQGKYLESMQYSNLLTLPGTSSPYPTTAVANSVLIEASGGIFSVSRNGGSWNTITLASFNHPICPASTTNNVYYYLSSRGGIMWVGFFYSGGAQQKHCLWAVDASSVVAGQSTPMRVMQAWGIGNKLCAATGDASFTYLILCDTHFISYAQLGSSLLHPLAGSVRAGYLDDSLRASLFNEPSSLVLHDSRLYVADTGNCVIRELDLLRDTVYTVAGTAGLCQRIDDILQVGALVYPTNLTYTQFDGFFLFVDKYKTNSVAFIRQFHVPTCTVRTVKAMPSDYFNEILAVMGGVMVRMEKDYQLLTASAAQCPPGTSSKEGSALTVRDCIACGSGLYSDADTGLCMTCSQVSCTQSGEMLVPCQLDKDSFCGACTNKPAGTVYTGPSTVPGTANCPWAYTPPCPIGYYTSNGLCSPCPAWSTTYDAGSRSIAQCYCLGGGYWLDGVTGVCQIPAYFLITSGTPGLVHFPLLTSCPDYSVDSPSGVCPCQPGEYIQQIHPKICTPCLDGFYSPDGSECSPCPYSTEPSLDKTTCRCAGGLRDVSPLSSSLPQCICGPGASFTSNSLQQCAACQPNTYNEVVITAESTNIILSRCRRCWGGTFSGSGASECSQCPFGTYRLSSSFLGCQECPAGKYAQDSRQDQCTDCVEACNGLKEIKCPTDPLLLICSQCSESDVRPNAYLNGGRDCATSCQNGFFERDGECTECQVFTEQSCSNGTLHVPCTAYSDAACVPCVNSSMPLNYAVWKYAPNVLNGPNAACEWECEPGYEPRRMEVDSMLAVWECVLAEAWGWWDLFTL